MFSNVIDISDKIKVSATISPTNATYQDIVWKSSDEEVVKVVNGSFVVKGAGRVTLTCLSHNEIGDKIDIIIINKTVIITIMLSCLLVISIILFLFIRKFIEKHKTI